MRPVRQRTGLGVDHAASEGEYDGWSRRDIHRGATKAEPGGIGDLLHLRQHFDNASGFSALSSLAGKNCTK